MRFFAQRFVSPGIKPGIDASGGLFPFFFRGQAFVHLRAISFSLIPGNARSGVGLRPFPEIIIRKQPGELFVGHLKPVDGERLKCKAFFGRA